MWAMEKNRPCFPWSTGCLTRLMEEILHQLMCSLSHYLPGLCITGGWFAPPQKENTNSNFQPFFRCTKCDPHIQLWEYGTPQNGWLELERAFPLWGLGPRAYLTRCFGWKPLASPKDSWSVVLLHLDGIRLVLFHRGPGFCRNFCWGKKNTLSQKFEKSQGPLN